MNSQPADLVLHSGQVLTIDAQFSAAQAVAVSGNRIAAVGDSEEVRGLVGPATKVVDLEGRTVIPGINDAHLHLASWALSRPPYQLDLSASAIGSLDALQTAVGGSARAIEADGWIVGHGWTEEHIADFDGIRKPHRTDLDAVSGGVPVALWHRSLHAVWVNSSALRLASIDSRNAARDGEIVCDPASGSPTGLLLEGAVDLVRDLIPEPSDQSWARAVTAGMTELNRRGVTSVSDPMVNASLMRRYVRLRDEQGLSLRLGMLHHWTPPGPDNSVQTLECAMRYVGSLAGLGDDWLRIAGVKLFADGIPPLHTSWMRQPFPCAGHGSLVTSGGSDAERLAELQEMVRVLHRNRFRIGVHVTGDMGCDAVAEAFVRVIDSDPWPDARHHVIHASLLSAEAARQLAERDVTASTNSLIKWQATDLLAEVFDEATNGYHGPVRTLIDAGMHVADASDAPITDPDWRQGVEMLVLRKARGSGAISGPDECITREEAIRAWTYEGAYQDQLEHVKGSIEAGKLADLVVLAENPLTIDAGDLHALSVDMTILDGRIVHSA